MKKFDERLHRCMRSGSLSVADLAHWFRRPYPTVRTWVHWGVTPRGPRLVYLLNDLAMLEHVIGKRNGFPIPSSIGHRERPQHIRQLYVRHARVPKSYPARKWA